MAVKTKTLDKTNKQRLAEKRVIRQKVKENTVRFVLFLCAALSIVTTIGIIFSLASGTISLFGEVSIVEFFTGTKWTPLLAPQHFGVLPLLSGTILTTFLACIIALPIGLATAIYLSEYAARKTRRILKPALEILSGIPTVVFGYFALISITPIIQKLVPSTSVFNAASASIVMATMVIPMVSSLSEDALVAVPTSLRAAAYGLGSTKLEVITRVVVPAARSGIVASFILAISRAIGETMIVMLAAGATPTMSLNPLKSIQTMTSYIAQVSLGDTPTGSIEYKTLFAVGAVLFLITTLINLIGQSAVRRGARG